MEVETIPFCLARRVLPARRGERRRVRLYRRLDRLPGRRAMRSAAESSAARAHARPGRLWHAKAATRAEPAIRPAGFCAQRADGEGIQRALLPQRPAQGGAGDRALRTLLLPARPDRWWNRIYGRRGIYQYQSVVPPDAARDATKAMLQAISASGEGSFLAVLKTFGDKPSPGMLSFPRPGRRWRWISPIAAPRRFAHGAARRDRARGPRPALPGEGRPHPGRDVPSRLSELAGLRAGTSIPAFRRASGSG